MERAEEAIVSVRLYHLDHGWQAIEWALEFLTKWVSVRLFRKKQLRRKVDTVGQVGKPGEQIHAVISVGMLSEGWDAKTVTHIVGLRAFSSQLLCEQVVGGGLRRTSYGWALPSGVTSDTAFKYRSDRRRKLTKRRPVLETLTPVTRKSLLSNTGVRVMLETCACIPAAKKRRERTKKTRSETEVVKEYAM